ncbi:aldo/keto reductase [Companilactobacillus nantensis]|uniref:Aldose reductase n=1 Tax=Companilactobacillus nantensis DSM 16982 TaxID=1423774 RepID=A0A0R1WJN8_9LACO|nr:aldo/keto reductase [Companilactobacillus nantensis]KRM17789.1 aldose reductase [Companilactobacillus nantensis DSM 16982]GEO63488.1 2,5-diketo-D-gluconic acid reductase [Companilactobacillus nantensis]
MSIFDETITLNNGVKIPKLALGVWEIPDDKVADAVKSAVDIGYRHIDTAQAYGNERGVGEGVRNASVSRDEIFVNSKVAAEIKNYDAAKQSIDETLNKMGLDYLDMMIIHNPQPWNEVNQGNDRHFEGNLETWRAMEDAVKAGKLKTIGVSSFGKEDLDNLIKNSSTKPAVNQVQIHIGDTPMDIIKYSQANDIAVEAFSPVAHGAAMKDERIKQMAAKYNVSVPQLCIRYDWQLNVIVLPKSANPEHMKANAELDFEISDEDMKTLMAIDQMDYGEASVFPVFGGKI